MTHATTYRASKYYSMELILIPNEPPNALVEIWREFDTRKKQYGGSSNLFSDKLVCIFTILLLSDLHKCIEGRGSFGIVIGFVASKTIFTYVSCVPKKNTWYLLEGDLTAPSGNSLICGRKRGVQSFSECVCYVPQKESKNCSSNRR